MIQQDVEDTGPLTRGEYGLSSFLVSPLSRDTQSPHAQIQEGSEKDLLFFMTRSYQALTYSDGGD